MAKQNDQRFAELPGEVVMELARAGAAAEIKAMEERRTLLVDAFGVDILRGVRVGEEMPGEPAPAPKRLHWTQRPENAAKVRAMSEKGRRTRRKAAARG